MFYDANKKNVFTYNAYIASEAIVGKKYGFLLFKKCVLIPTTMNRCGDSLVKKSSDEG